MSVIDRGNNPLSEYLLRVLLSLLRKNDGEIRIPALEMVETENNGEGLIRHYDSVRKELVLRLAQSGSEVYFIKGDNSCLQGSSTNLEKRLLAPLSQPAPYDQQAGQSRQRSSAAQTEPRLSAEDLFPPQEPLILTDEALAAREASMLRQKRETDSARALTSFPENPTRTRLQPSRPPSQRIQDAFLKR